MVAGEPGAHVFSFQGTTRRAARGGSRETFPGAARVELAHRPPGARPVAIAALGARRTPPRSTPRSRGSCGGSTSRTACRGATWRWWCGGRARTSAGLLRALDDARIPRAVPERGLSLDGGAGDRALTCSRCGGWWPTEPSATSWSSRCSRPTWSGSRRPRRAGLVRAAAAGPAPRAAAAALERTEGLAPEEADGSTRARERSRRRRCSPACRCRTRSASCGGSSPARAGWSRRTDADARRDLDTVVTFANVVAEAGEQGDTGVAAFLEALDAGEHGPGCRRAERPGADAVQVLTAHGAVGLEFDTVLVAGAVEGNFPSLSRPEPMFDLAVLDRARHERPNATGSGSRTSGVCSAWCSGGRGARVVLVAADTHPDADELSARSRFVDELRRARGRGA